MQRTSRWVLAALVTTATAGLGVAFAGEPGVHAPAVKKKGKSKPSKIEGPKKKAAAPEKAVAPEKAAAPAKPAVSPRAKDYGNCPPGPIELEEQVQGRKLDARCTAIGDPGSVPCKKDSDCPSNTFAQSFEACVEGCCLLRCSSSRACLWDQVCREKGATKNDKVGGSQSAVCMRVETACPAYSDANACDGQFDDAACGGASVCVHRTKCDLRGQCCPVVCATDADCIDGGRCKGGLCQGK